MKQYEYKVTLHSASEFETYAYFCSETGSCSHKEVPDAQIANIEKILNKFGAEGWVLVQTVFGKDGMSAFWKREVL